jgi:hypothetical protein
MALAISGPLASIATVAVGFENVVLTPGQPLTLTHL